MAADSPGASEESMDQTSASNRNILTAAKGGGIIFFGRLFEYASRFVFGILVARAIGAEGLGLYTLGITVAIALAEISTLGIPSGVVRFLPVAIQERDEARIWGLLQTSLALVGAVALVLAFVLFGLSKSLAEHLFHQPDAVAILRWISVCIPLTAIGRVLLAATRGYEQMQYQVYANSIVFNVLKIILSVLLLAIGLGVTGVLAAHVLAWAVEIGLLFYFLNRLFPLRRPIRTAHRDVRKLLSFSLPVGLTQLVNQFGGNFEILLLGALTVAAVVGIYSAALRVQMVGVMFLMAVQTVAMPIISSLHHQGDDVQLSRLYQTLTRWSLSFVLPFFITVLLFAEPILHIFGSEFEAGAPVLVIVSLGTLVNGGTGICGAMLVMTGHSRLVFVNSVISLIAMVTFDLLFIPIWGAIGAAVAFALSVSMVNAARLVQVHWLHKLWPYDATFLKPLVAGVAVLIVGLVTSRFVPADQNLFFLVLNLAVLWLSFAAIIVLLGLSEEDRVVLSHVKRRFSKRIAWGRMPL